MRRDKTRVPGICLSHFFFTFQLLDKLWYSGVVPSPPRYVRAFDFYRA